MMMWDYDPASLPEIDTIHLCLLGGHTDREFVTVFATDHRYILKQAKVLSGDEAQQVATLWRSLPLSSVGRCPHDPPYGLRFFQDNQLLLQASLCWRCLSVLIRQREELTGFGFDAESEPAQALLVLCKTLAEPAI